MIATEQTQTADQYLARLYETRRRRLAHLVNLFADGNAARFASALGYAPWQMEQFVTSTEHRSRSIGERAARTIEAKARLPFGWLDGHGERLETNHVG